jgi:hypothetical protein
MSDHQIECLFARPFTQACKYAGAAAEQCAEPADDGQGQRARADSDPAYDTEVLDDAKARQIERGR